MKKLIGISLVMSVSISFLISISVSFVLFEFNQTTQNQTTQNQTLNLSIDNEKIVIQDGVREGDKKIVIQDGVREIRDGIINADELLSEAVRYYTGNEGLTKNYKKSFELSLKSAKLGNNFAQVFVAALYANGHGVEKDFVESYTWFLVAHSSGNKNIQGLDRQILDMESVFTSNQIESGQNRAKEIKKTIALKKKKESKETETK